MEIKTKFYLDVFYPGKDDAVELEIKIEDEVIDFYLDGTYLFGTDWENFRNLCETALRIV